MPAASTVKIEEVFAWLRAIDLDALDLAGVQQAMRATRPLRGWLDVVDAKLRTHHQELLAAAADEIEAQGHHGSWDDADSGAGSGDGAGAGSGDGAGAGSDEDAGAGAGSGSGEGAGADADLAGAGGHPGPPPIDLGPPLPSNPFANPIDQAGGVSTSEGRRRSLRAQILRRFADLESALMSGQITIEHLDVIARALHGLNEQVDRCLDEHADRIVSASLELQPTALRRHLVSLITRITAELGLTRTHTRIPPSTLRLWGDATTGAGTLHATLTPGHYQRVSALIEAAGRALAAGADQRNLNRDQLAAQALMHLLGIEANPGEVGHPASDRAGSNRSGTGRAGTGRAGTGRAGTGRAGTGRAGTGRTGTGRAGSGRAGTGRAGTSRTDTHSTRTAQSSTGPDRSARPQVTAVINILVDAETLFVGPHDAGICEYADGTPIDLAELRQLACTSPIVPIVVGGGTLPLNVGRQQRLATNAQHRALEAIYSTCAIPGCSVAVTRCEMHHIDYYEHGGRTDLDNLVPLCSNHHHRLHEQRWHLKLEPDRTLTITHANGSTLTSVPDRLTRHHQRRSDPNSNADDPDDD